MRNYHEKNEYKHKINWPGFYRNTIFIIILIFSASASEAEGPEDTSALYASLNNYHHVSEKKEIIQEKKFAKYLPVFETKVKIRSYLLKDDKYFFPDTPLGIFFEDLSEDTESQINTAREDIRLCNNNPECNYNLSIEHGIAFRDSVVDSLLFTLANENRTIGFTYEKLNKIETYFTAYFDPGSKTVYNPILTHFESDTESNEDEIVNGKNTIKFILNYTINQGVSGEIRIPDDIIDMRIRHKIDSEETRLLMRFPLYNDLQFKVVRKTDDEYLGIVQISLSTERFEERIYNFFNPEQGTL